MIRDQLLAALHAALDAAGFPDASDGRRADHAQRPVARRLHHQRRPPARQAARDAAARRRRQDRGRARACPPAAPRAGRDRGSRVPQPSTSRPRGCTTCSLAVVAAGRGLRSRATRSPACASTSSSSRPTRPGPLHAGGGRWVAVGDAIANLLAAQGAEVHREYYLNDAGNQLDTFARLAVSPATAASEPPEDGYQGEYLVDMADRMRAELGDDVHRGAGAASGATGDVVREPPGRPRRASACTSTPGSPSARCTSAATSPTCSTSSTRRGVVVRARRRHLAAHHRLRRPARPRARASPTAPPPISATTSRTTATSSTAAATHLIDIWGADHHGQVKSLQAGMEALGFPRRRARDHPRPAREARAATASEVRMSKRTGNIITLADILDEVDPDVARLTFLLQGIDTAQTFDLDVVTAQSMENPVYYVQYAHARIASIGRKAARAGVAAPAARRRRPRRCSCTSASSSCCARSRAIPTSSREAAELRAPQKVTTWVRDFAERVPRLLPRLPGDHRRRRAHAGAAVAAEACRIGLAERARHARRARARRDGAPRRRRRRRRAVDAMTRRSTSRCCRRRPTVDADGRRRDRRRRPRRRSPREFGTPLFVYDEDDICGPLPRVPSPRFGDGRGVREQGVPLHRDGQPRRTRRACTSTSRPAASCTSRSRAGVPARAASCSTATTSPTAELRAALDAASAASSSTPSTSSTGSRRWSRDGLPAPRVHGPRHARRRGAHPRVHRDRHGRLEVRLHASPTATRVAAARRVRRAAARCGFVGLPLPHRLAGLPARLVRGGGRQMVAASSRESRRRPARRSTSSTSAAASACATSPTTTPPTIARVRGRVRDAVAKALRRRRRALAPAARRSKPGRSIAGAGRHHALHASARSRRSPASAPTSRSTAA